MDCIRLLAPNFIFTTSIPPCVAAAAKTSIAYLKEHNVNKKFKYILFNF
jgi:5-aminolevulinate synthase